MAPAAAPESLVSCSPTICSPIASGDRARAMIKGKVEGLVGYARRNFMVPIPHALSFAELNAKLLECCRRRLNDRLRGHDDTIGERLARDREALLALPPAPYDACEKKPAWVSSLSLVRYRGNDYSVPTAYGHREVLVRGYVKLTQFRRGCWG